MSDVPLGVFLSGGVDSGAIVALAARALGDTKRLTTLTVVFDEASFCEGAAAREVAERFGTDHREVRVTRDGFAAMLPRVVAAMDQPTNDGVNTFVVSQAARDAGLTVVLSGLGGDELFWGYPQYKWLAGAAGRLAHCPGPVRRGLARALSGYGRLRGQEKWMRMAYLRRAAAPHDMYLVLRGFFPPQQVARLLGLSSREVDDAVEQHFSGLSTQPAEGQAPSTQGAAYNRLEFGRYMHDQLLRDADVFSMAHSVETRVPLLDHRLVEEVTALGEGPLLHENRNKPVLVDAVGDPHLSAAASSRKMGFSFPMDGWMRSTGGVLEDMALSSTSLERGAVDNCWRAFRGGRLHWSRAWALSMVGGTGH